MSEGTRSKARANAQAGQAASQKPASAATDEAKAQEAAAMYKLADEAMANDEPRSRVHALMLAAAELGSVEAIAEVARPSSGFPKALSTEWGDRLVGIYEAQIAAGSDDAIEKLADLYYVGNCSGDRKENGERALQLLHGLRQGAGRGRCACWRRITRPVLASRRARSWLTSGLPRRGLQPRPRSPCRTHQVLPR